MPNTVFVLLAMTGGVTAIAALALLGGVAVCGGF